MSNCKFLHLMWNDKFNSPFVDFLNEFFNEKEHDIYCMHRYSDFPFPKGNNVTRVDYFKNTQIDFSKYNKIFCHGLFIQDVVDLLYKSKEVLNKTYWIVWGGDLYNAIRNEKNDYVRKNVKGYLLFAKNDSKVILSIYGVNLSDHEVLPIEYPLSVDISMYDKLVTSSSQNITIQINNSCDKSTLEILDILSTYRMDGIRITTILSYGQTQYKEQIINKGKLLYGNNFGYLDELLSPSDYASHLSEVDIYIANQNRQQGTANIDMMLYLGKKVFIRKDVSTYDMYTSLGYKIYDTNTIKDLSFEDFIKDEYSLQNKEKASYFTSKIYRKKLWENAFKC